MNDLHLLGWQNFQQLCLTICREVLGQAVESFLDSNDGGRDGAFVGTWKRHGSEAVSGQFVIQCKFTSRLNYNLSLSDLTDEIEKAKRLVDSSRCDVYVLITNAGLSGASEKAISAAYESVGVKHILQFGASWIWSQIQESKRLRMLVPRVYGLGDLSQILDERAYAQARALLDSMSEDLAKIVMTRTYQQAASAVEQHGFVLLIGEPAAGKTTIASLLAMAAIDLWGASPIKLDEATSLIELWNADDPSQLFWVDDAFGVTQYEHHLIRSWNHVLPQIKAMLKQGVKVVMTSRDYIYNRARNDLKESAFPLLCESQVVIDVHKLSKTEKQQILYNHLKMGEQPKSFKTAIKPYLEHVSDHKRFIPETARRLADPKFTKGLNVRRYELDRFVHDQKSFLRDTLLSLDSDSKAALALIYMRNDNLVSPIQLTQAEAIAIERLGSNLGGCTDALASLKNSFVQLSAATGDHIWRFRHPTIGDAYAAQLSNNPEMLEIFVQGSSTEKLIDQITCGDVGYENAVVLPRTLFPTVVRRLDEFGTSTAYKTKWMTVWHAKRRTLDFLARRCTKEFLELYICSHPDLLSNVASPGLSLSAVAEVDVALKLYEFGLFPEENRLQLVDTVTRYAVNGDDLYALTDIGLREMLTDYEYEVLHNRVRLELIPRIDEVREQWQLERDTSETRQDKMQPLLESLDTIKDLYDDPEVKRVVELEAQLINSWIEEEEEDENVVASRESLSDLGSSQPLFGDRSIFDDVDT